MKTRVITGIIMGIVFIPILLLGGWFMAALGTVLSYIATYELIKMHNTKRGLEKKYQFIIPIYSALIVMTGCMTLLLPKHFDNSDLFFCLLVIFVSLLIVSLFNKKLKITDLLLYFGFILYGGLGIFLAVRCRFINSINGFENKYIGLILMGYVLLTTVFTDMGAYNFGLLFGKHKLCPSISPKKTIEGAIGGSFTGTLVGTIYLSAFSYSLNFSLFGINNQVLNIVVIAIITCILTVFAQFGDLIASKLKREYEIKDYGFIFPGHGGVMDRFDSLIITGSTFLIILILFGVVTI